jgi:hypothetical protein
MEIKKIKEFIDEFYQEQKEQHRPHMGASLLGNECDRYLWLSFRAACDDSKTGRMKRLLKRGNQEESKFIEYLRNIGIHVIDGFYDKKLKKKTQHYIDLGWHIKGSYDGIARNGVPDNIYTPFILEFKTHNDKSFKSLVKNGVKASHFTHFVQMQIYMLGSGINRALYCAVNKNDDDLYFEQIDYSEDIAKFHFERGVSIVKSISPPQKLSNDPTYYKCKMCSFYDYCHKEKLHNRNCRTCVHSIPMPDSTWRCEKFQANNIPFDYQMKGCKDQKQIDGI